MEMLYRDDDLVIVSGAGELDQVPHRIILVPPRLTDSQLKALLHAWCSHDAAVGYMIVLDTTLPGVRTNRLLSFCVRPIAQTFNSS